MSAVLKPAPSIVPMRREDLDAVVATARAAYPFPWTRANFSDSLNAGYSAWVCRMEDELMGYAVMMLVLDEAHLLNITVASAWQRRGYGSLLVYHLFATARRHGAIRMFLEVRLSNAGAIKLYRRFGFNQVGQRRGYYLAAQGREDAIVMAVEV